MATKDDRLNTLSPAAVPPQTLRMPPAKSIGEAIGGAFAVPAARQNAYFNAYSAAAPGYADKMAADADQQRQSYISGSNATRSAWANGQSVGGYSEPNALSIIRGIRSGYQAGVQGSQPADPPPPLVIGGTAKTTPFTMPANLSNLSVNPHDYMQPNAMQQQPLVTQAASNAPAAAPLPNQPDYWNDAQAAKTQAVMDKNKQASAATSNAPYTMDNVPQGGGYMSWGGAMGKDTMAKLDPSQRAQFQQPGSLSITPDQASALAKRVMTVPAESFHRPMASSDQAVAEARNAAMDRGDFEGVRRSYLTPEQRKAENDQRAAAMADRAEQQRLESMATQAVSPSMPWGQMMTAAGNRRFARDRLQQMAAERVQNAKIASDDKQQAFANQIALANAQANQTRANAALTRPGKFKVVSQKQFKDDGTPLPDKLFSMDEQTGALTPMDAGATTAISEEQINATMAATGMTRDAVMAELKARGMVQ